MTNTVPANKGERWMLPKPFFFLYAVCAIFEAFPWDPRFTLIGRDELAFCGLSTVKSPYVTLIWVNWELSKSMYRWLYRLSFIEYVLSCFVIAPRFFFICIFRFGSTLMYEIVC